eukprot:symbB.v1.2.027736.t1/scaffold2870.1/size68455/1
MVLCQVLALFNDYLTKVFKKLDPSMWRWVSYEELCNSWVQKCYDEVGQELGDFLGLKAAALSRAFRYFKPSRKDASAEMSSANLRVLKEIEARKGRAWFPHLFPGQQLLKQFAVTSEKLVIPKEVPPEDDDETAVTISQQNPAFQQLWDTLSASQRQLVICLVAMKFLGCCLTMLAFMMVPMGAVLKLYTEAPTVIYVNAGGKKVATSSASTNTSSVTPSKRADATEESKEGPAAPRMGSGSMFDNIAVVYDKVNKWMTFGLDEQWRATMVK